MSYYPKKPSKLQRLEDRVDELEEKNERLREAMADALFASDQGLPRDAASYLRDALDGGGEKS